MNQAALFATDEVSPVQVGDAQSTTFADNMKLPVHRWFRYTAGFSAQWAKSVIEASGKSEPVVLDPFAGSGTTLLASDDLGVQSYGIEAHPFVARVARAKLLHAIEPCTYIAFANEVWDKAQCIQANLDEYPPLILKCYDVDTLAMLDKLKRALQAEANGTPESELTWLTLVSILRKVSHVNTAQWQYVLPSKSKGKVINVTKAWADQVKMFATDMATSGSRPSYATLLQTDARTCEGVPDKAISVVVTSPPYPNNYDYADATRLEMSFMGDIKGWGDLQDTVRQHLIRSCSQHVPERAINLEEVLQNPVLAPIQSDIAEVCRQMGEIRLTKGGKKTYHLMVACYFLDLGRTWHSLRRVCEDGAKVCYVVGDSAPYGVYVPVVDWLGRLALDAGFDSFSFDQTRERNTKWKNRKHRVPLCEGRLWVNG